MLTPYARRALAVRPVPDARARLRLRHLVPLLAFLAPSIVIGYGVVLPDHGADGLDELSVGFAATLVSAAATYVVGVRAALRAPRS